jgi:energy-coupling factor transporter ATP-binding protein EcfA2
VAQAAIVTAEQAAYQYGGSGNTVGPFDLTVEGGDFHLISGPSGCGKSTLARMLAGLIPHLYRGRFDGRVRIDGRPSCHVPLWELSTRVGLVAQNPAAQVLASTVADEIAFGLDTVGLWNGERESRVQETLANFGLADCAERDPRTLSGGEQQKLMLAALSARQPRALVLDEPLSMLDRAATAQVLAQLAHWRRDGTAVVVFEHRTRPFASVEGLKRLRVGDTQGPERPLPDLPDRVPAFRVRATGVGVELGGRHILRDVELDLAGGQAVAIIGANGSGKTTLLRALAGLQAHYGQVTGVGGARPLLGICFQNADRQIFNATVRQEILFGLRTHDEGFYRSVLELLDLTPYEQTPPLLLSEGEKKRLALAIVLLRPGLCGVCLDEPTLGQDADQRRILGRIIRRLAGAGYLCLIATHDRDWAAQWSDRLLLLQGGRLVATVHPSAPDALRRLASRSPCHATAQPQ